jgi:hypothetical protein
MSSVISYYRKLIPPSLWTPRVVRRMELSGRVLVIRPCRYTASSISEQVGIRPARRRSLGEVPAFQGDVHLELLSSIAAAAIAMKLLISSATSPPPLVRCMRMMPTRSLAGSTHA